MPATVGYVQRELLLFGGFAVARNENDQHRPLPEQCAVGCPDPQLDANGCAAGTFRAPDETDPGARKRRPEFRRRNHELRVDAGGHFRG